MTETKKHMLFYEHCPYCGNSIDLFITPPTDRYETLNCECEHCKRMLRVEVDTSVTVSVSATYAEPGFDGK